MDRLKQTMRCHLNPNKRADTQIMYALGLRNSVHRCWFLTRYSGNRDISSVKEELSEIAYQNDALIYRCEKYISQSNKLIHQAIMTYTDKERAARQLRKLLYFRKIMDKYGDTETAYYFILHCDKWRDYAKSEKSMRK